jgi:hypothetical protein
MQTCRHADMWSGDIQQSTGQAVKVYACEADLQLGIAGTAEACTN